ncbi:hypothetical protein GGI43DRAFT_417627 [Trichoderma evansii]
MAAMIDSPVIKELAKILEDVDFFPNPNDPDIKTCRAFNKDNTGRCRIRLAQEDQNQIDSLLSQLQAMKKCVGTNDFFDKMEKFISCTHCPRYHRKNAIKALSRWKIQRKAAISSPRPVTPLGGATGYNDSFESISDTSSMGSHSFASDTLEYDESALDSYIAGKIQGLAIATAAQDTPVQTIESDFDEVEVEAERQRFKRLGDVEFPEKDKKHDGIKIYQTIEKCLGKKSMDAGLLYVLEHTEISGLFKIGWSRASANQRLKQGCYKNETMLIHSTQSQTIIGALQAERIAHAILDHKRLLIKCSRCNKTHKEWFLVSKKQALDAVMLAERWLRMPAYALSQGKYILTPEADDIHKLLLPFSMSKMEVLMDKVKKSDNASGTIPEATATAAVRKTSKSRVSPVSSDRATPRIFISKSPDTTPYQSSNLRESSPAGAIDSKGELYLLETEEIIERRSRETTPDGNYIFVTEQKIIRRKLSRKSLEREDGDSGYSEPAAFDYKGQKQRGTKVKVQEIRKA